MKKAFKNGYSKDIQAILNSKGIVGKKGIPYGQSYINHVFNGRNCNEDIEDALFELYQKRIYETSKKHLQRKAILDKKRTEAGTPILK
jgi:methyltransferase-like protein